MYVLPPIIRPVDTQTSADGVELILMIVGTFSQATAGEGQAISIIAMLIFWRFIVGHLIVLIVHCTDICLRSDWALAETTPSAPPLHQNLPPPVSEGR